MNFNTAWSLANGQRAAQDAADSRAKAERIQNGEISQIEEDVRVEMENRALEQQLREMGPGRDNSPEAWQKYCATLEKKCAQLKGKEFAFRKLTRQLLKEVNGDAPVSLSKRDANLLRQQFLQGAEQEIIQGVEQRMGPPKAGVMRSEEELQLLDVPSREDPDGLLPRPEAVKVPQRRG